MMKRNSDTDAGQTKLCLSVHRHNSLGFSTRATHQAFIIAADMSLSAAMTPSSLVVPFDARNKIFLTFLLRVGAFSVAHHASQV
jgi:hypothetical protein